MSEYIIIKQANKHLKTHFHLHPLAPAVTTALSQALFFPLAFIHPISTRV